MKKIYILIIVAAAMVLTCCKKEKALEPTPVAPTSNTHLIDIEPTNYNTAIYINSSYQTPAQGVQQFSLTAGDSIYINFANQFQPYISWTVKDNGVLLYQASNIYSSYALKIN